MKEQLKQLIGKEGKDVSPSPYGRWLNGKLVNIEETGLTATYFTRPEFANPGGIVHGGVLAGIMDELIGMTAYAEGKEGFFVASNINVDFLRPARVGEELIVKTKLVRAGKTMMHIECQIYNSHEKLIAKAASNLIKMELKG
jgi:acyl-coenzyme A thioesterase 13